jgi:hypothetical protein
MLLNMPQSSAKPGHKLGANRKEPARKHRPRQASESKDIREDRGTLQSKFSKRDATPSPATNARPTGRASRAANTGRESVGRPPAPLLAEHASGAEFHVVHLRVSNETACQVFVAGSFNGWNPARAPLECTAAGTWEIALSLAPGEYEYRFVADDQWLDDPSALRHVTNPFGGVNAVLEVPGGQAKAGSGKAPLL